MNLKCRDAPGIEFVLVNLNIVVVIWQTFAKTAKSHAPLARLAQRILEIDAETRGRHSALPTVSAAATLIAVAAQKILVLGLHIPKTGNLNTVGTIAERHFVFMAGTGTGCCAAHVVIN